MAGNTGWARFAVVACALAFVQSMTPAVDAQAPALPAAAFTTMVGSVRDTAGRPISGVEVRLQGGPVLARTNDSGGFRVVAVPVGQTTVNVRRLGFAPAKAELTLRAGRTDSLVFALGALAASLPGVLVEDEYMKKSLRMLAGFWDRRSRGFGHFLTRDQIEKSQAQVFSDLLRMVPSAHLVNDRYGRRTIRFKRSVGTRDCPPQYFVDGMRLESASPEEFNPGDTEAIEIYAGPSTIPPQFAPRPFTNTCGAIVIWTRLPGV